MRQKLAPVFFLLCFWASAQHQNKVDFTHGEILVEPIPQEKKIIGKVLYRFEILDNVDSVFLDSKNTKYKTVKLDDKKANYTTTNNTISIYKKFKKGKSYKLFLEYYATPMQTLYFLGWDDDITGNEQIWTQGQGKYTSHWLPSFDDMEEKVEFDLNVQANKNFKVVANGKLVDVTKGTFENPIRSFDMQNPMSSYLLAFAIGNYNKKELTSASGIPIENYYYPQDSLRVEPTFRHTKEIFDFLEAEIGVPYPWQNYKQIPVRDFLYAGMENTSATIFSDGYVIDSTAFVDKNYVNVNAHELAHQWFGNLVTEKDSNHHWLHEGFATYYAYLAEQHIIGDDHFYWKLYRTLRQLQQQAEKGEGQSLLEPKASSLTFYEKGAWALYMLRNHIGDVAFKTGIRTYLEKHRFGNVTVSDFLKEMEIANGQDVTGFRKDWLESTSIPFAAAKKQLRKDAKSIDLLFAMEEQFLKVQSNDIDYVSYWDKTNSIHLKQYIITQYGASLPEEIYAKTFVSDTIPLRQALLSNRDLPTYVNKEKLLSLLEDNSYVTKEAALMRLWQVYPEDRNKYLDATKDVIGLPNKNMRILWLTLAMLSEDYNAPLTKDYFDELSSYTGDTYAFEVRQSAFFYLKEGFGLNEESLTNLVRATNHHSWQFKKFARDLINELLKDNDYKVRLEKMRSKLNSEESRYLNSKLN